MHTYTHTHTCVADETADETARAKAELHARSTAGGGGSVPPCALQGLFIRHQQQVAATYASIVANSIVTARNLLHELTRGPGQERFIGMAKVHTRVRLNLRLRLRLRLLS